ncbi:exodeoxyribonuclease VII small subunit [Catenulispora sp. NF23]|uniref:Exodeoxyribonuclease 7 small subunit n=1 Tax=Catenulispora pinistramenti TaxID=2705254 RepID=A0ABS5KUE2_9ACTN|nr:MULTISPECIES: exodeoxyribonuclease VII small subunit [Catenulispora]MBS2533259.1 exodeoxyribonuclease VII small subunit [Catenulispora pinistramenti]MBS2549657.1 exodeoxyribonuclease VII small subunit [Catenulispora pinistramenti]
MANETTPTAAEPQDLSHLGYEQARDELMDVVRRLETGGLTLEDSLAAWERGEALAKHCQAKLDGARARLDAAIGAGNGEGGEG